MHHDGQKLFTVNRARSACNWISRDQIGTFNPQELLKTIWWVYQHPFGIGSLWQPIDWILFTSATWSSESLLCAKWWSDDKIPDPTEITEIRPKNRPHDSALSQLWTVAVPILLEPFLCSNVVVKILFTHPREMSTSKAFSPSSAILSLIAR